MAVTCVEVYLEGRKEMFYLTTHSTHFIYGYYGIRQMVKDHSDRIAHTTAFVAPVVEHWLEVYLNSVCGQTVLKHKLSFSKISYI